MKTLPPLWERILNGCQSPPWRKERWQLLRKGELPAQSWNNLTGHWREDFRYASEDGKATKLRLQSRVNGDVCETVILLPRPHRATVCVSTQIGCAVGCTFCATGRMGLQRQLSGTEILEQVLRARRVVHGWCESSTHAIHLRNVVFMGMGEPLHNEIATHEALEFLIADAGFGFSPRHITLSTAGVPEKMIAAARRFPRLRIALSLHAADRDLRRRLVPRATNDLRALRAAIEAINSIDREGPVWIEYALLADINDSESHARLLADFCRGLRVEINVIPFNDISHSEIAYSETGHAKLRAPDLAAQNTFVRVLREQGLFTTLRNTLGRSIQAACGQLIANSPSLSDRFDQGGLSAATPS